MGVLIFRELFLKNARPQFTTSTDVVFAPQFGVGVPIFRELFLKMQNLSLLLQPTLFCTVIWGGSAKFSRVIFENFYSDKSVGQVPAFSEQEVS